MEEEIKKNFLEIEKKVVSHNKKIETNIQSGVKVKKLCFADELSKHMIENIQIYKGGSKDA